MVIQNIRWLPALWVVVTASTYSLLGVLRYDHFQTGGYDLGIFDQAIWHYSRLEVPGSTIRNISNLLGDHFHPILVVLAPLYWVFHSPIALLVAQSILLAVAVLPIYNFSARRLGKTSALLIAVGYTFYWGIQNAAAFDFHEIAFAVPLIAYAVDSLDQQNWRPYWIYLVLLLFVKEDLSLLVATFGILMAIKKHYWQGLGVMVLGVVWFEAVTRVFIPYFSGVPYAYWSYGEFGKNPISALFEIIRSPINALHVLFSPIAKVHTQLATILPFLGICILSPYFILAVPLLLERFLSTNSLYWYRDFHYTATLAPILMMSFADAIARIYDRFKRQGTSHRRLIIGLAATPAIIGLILLPKFPLFNLLKPSYYMLSSTDRVGKLAVSKIPSEASVTSQDAVASHLSERQKIYDLRPKAPDSDYVIADTSLTAWPNPDYETVQAYLNVEKLKGYHEIFFDQGWVVLKP
jgi:uncharacterized membrane protein